MHFLPTDDQLQLQRGVRDLLADRFPLERLPGGFQPDVWQALSETGVFALQTELDLGLADAALVFEELGRACVPGPLVGTFLAAQRGMHAVAVLDMAQTPLLVAHLDTADAVLVFDGDELQWATGLSGTSVTDPVDPLTPLTEITGTPDAEMFAAGVSATRKRLEGAVLTAALQVGLATRLTELAVDYAKSREQFGRVIGSFQAVKHICADMLVRAELARVAVHAAAVTMDAPPVGQDGDVLIARAVAGAKLLADEAATLNGRAGVQVHGGMGFTWETPVHFFLKRAWLHATEFGTADEHAEELAGLL